VPRFLADTNCIVAAVRSRHMHHSAATSELTRRLNEGQVMLVAAHSPVEAYSVLSRLPPPERVSPADALSTIQQSVIDRAEIVALDANSYVAFLRQASERSVAGGRIYDAVIAACAVHAGADTVLTFNERHFRPLLPESGEVVVPSE
jgi:predicted nucleic acid-binding protein